MNVTELMQHIFKSTYSYKKKNMPAEPEEAPAFRLSQARHSVVATKEQKEEKKKKGGCC